MYLVFITPPSSPPSILPSPRRPPGPSISPNLLQMQADQPNKTNSFIWRLYPSKRSFQINDQVYVRPKSVKELGAVGRVVDGTSFETQGLTPTKRQRTNERTQSGINQSKQPNIETRDRIPVHQTNGITRQFRPSRLVPIYDHHHTTTILLTPDTTHYRQLAVAHLGKNDKVLEIGCSTGMCTAFVLRRLLILNVNDAHATALAAPIRNAEHGQIVAFDTGSDMVNQTKQSLQSEFTNLSAHSPQHVNDLSSISSVHKVDAFADPKGAYALATRDDKHPDIVLIDIGGNRELDGITRMIDWVQNILIKPPRVVIVKSKELTKQLHANSNGLIENGQSWLMTYLQRNNLSNRSAAKPPSFSHPLQAPLVPSPRDCKTPICRFHNYHVDGCKRHKNGNECELDHEYCHWCKQKGHVARECLGS